VLYIERDVHKRAVSYCVKDVSCKIHAADTISATIGPRTSPEITSPAVDGSDKTDIFTRIQDHPRPHAAAVMVAHPWMLRAIVVARKKNDGIDTSQEPTVCLAIFCLSDAWMASAEIRMKNKIEGRVLARTTSAFVDSIP